MTTYLSFNNFLSSPPLTRFLLSEKEKIRAKFSEIWGENQSKIDIFYHLHKTGLQKFKSSIKVGPRNSTTFITLFSQDSNLYRLLHSQTEKIVEKSLGGILRSILEWR